MRTKYTINELLFKIYLICVILGSLLRNMLGEWEPIYDTYRFVSKGRWGTFFLSFSSIIILVLIFRCFIQYIKKVHAGIRILIISSIIYYLIWTVLALDKAPAQSVFFESISTSVILLPVAALLGFDDNIWNILENKLPYINILFCCCFYIAVFSFWANYGIKWPMNASYKGIFSCWFTSACIMTFLDFPQKDKRKLIYCNLLLIIAAAFITQSRAWVLQTLILLFIFVAVLGDRNRSVKILMGFLLIIIAVLGVSYIFPEITGNLFNRGMEDTRSGQYVIFFAQHSWEDLIFGLGINASYSYLGNKNYTYFDNQFMFVMFHYGIFPVIAWLCAYASTLKGSKIYVIAISKYLYQHYLEQNCNTILLPPIFPEADKKKKLIRENSDNRKVLKIVYAGALASKDYIDTLLHAIIRLNTDEVRVVIDIIGPDKMQVQKLVGNDELEKYGIYCHGRLSHDKTLSIVEKADLSVLLRMNKRYAKAGVSTKFCEAMMLGVPSICTSVGGTDLFIKDKYNGFLVRDNDLNTLEATLLDIISLSRDQIEEIKNNALTTANELFTPDKYIEQFNAFLNKCK